MAFNLRSWLPWTTNNPPPTSSPPPTQSPALNPSRTLPESTRLRRQLSLLLGGSAFLVLSVSITRRAILRRRLATIPQYYHPNTRPPLVPPNGAMEAVEALNLATLNTFSFGMMLTGGGMFAMDVASIDEFRDKVRIETGLEVAEKEAEEEFEEWIVGVLARKERKEVVRRMVQREMEREKSEKEGGA